MACRTPKIPGPNLTLSSFTLFSGCSLGGPNLARCARRYVGTHRPNPIRDSQSFFSPQNPIRDSQSFTRAPASRRHSTSIYLYTQTWPNTYIACKYIMTQTRIHVPHYILHTDSLGPHPTVHRLSSADLTTCR